MQGARRRASVAGVRVRFAPSPTGALHIGGARTALFNWLLARHAGGELVLRIEDTDRERSTPENVEQILDALRWLELDWDEGPIFQTERARAPPRGARGAARRGARLPLERDRRGREGVQAASTAPSAASAASRRGATGAVRLRVPDEGATVVTTSIRGDTRFEHVHLDDPVIARADGSVLYNFAVAIDDLDAASRTWCAARTTSPTRPSSCSCSRRRARSASARARRCRVYAHLPLLHGPDGKKLSKRHGAASVQELRDAGYLPEAVRNYLALLGWGAGDDSTVLSTEELIERFTLERVSRNPARFDEAKLRWLNGVYIRELPVGRADARASKPSPAASGARPGGARSARRRSRRSPTSGRWRALSRRPVDDPKARERWLGEDGPRGARRGARERSRRCERFEEAAIERALEGVIERARRASRARSTSRCGSRSPARPSRRASSRASRCSAARRRCADRRGAGTRLSATAAPQFRAGRCR